MGLNSGRISIGLSGGNAVDEVVVVADDAARLALPVSEGLFVLQLDRDELWEYDAGTAAWVRIAGIEAANPYTFAGYNGVGENRPIPGWFWINQPAQVQNANIANPALAATVTDYGILQDVSPIDGVSLGVFTGVVISNLFGGLSAMDVNWLTLFSASQTYDVNATLVDAAIFRDESSYLAGPASNSHISFHASTQVDRDIFSLQGMIVQNLVGSSAPATLNFVSEFASFSVFQNNATVTNYTGFNLAPSFSNVGSLVGFTGININTTANSTGMAGWRTIQANPQLGIASATDINNYIDLQIYPTFGAFADLTSGYTGVQVSPTFQTGALSGGVVQMFMSNPVVDIAALSSFSYLSGTSQIGTNSLTALSLYQGISLADTLGANLAIDNMYGFSLTPNPQPGASVTTNFYGFNVGPSSTLPVGGSAYAINIDMTNFQTTTQKVGIQVNDGAGLLYSNWNTSVLPASPGFMNQHALGGTFTVASGSPMTNTLSAALNFGQVSIFLDDMGPDAFGGFIGRTELFMASQIAIDAGKTVDTFNNAIFAASVPVTGVSGGTLTNASNIRIGGFLPQGGDTISITNQYGINIMSMFNSFGATNAWGIFVDDSTVDNYFSKSISINTTTKKSAAGVGLEVYQKNIVMDEGEFWAYDPSTSGFKSVLKASTLAADTLFALPPTNGNASEVLVTDGAGNTSWSNVPVPNVQNTPAAPQSLNNNDTISIDDTRQKNIVFVSGNAAAITVDATTGVQDGTFDGQECVLVGMDDTNTVTLDSSGNVEINGSVTLGYHDSITLMWDNTNSVWFELARS